MERQRFLGCIGQLGRVRAVDDGDGVRVEIPRIGVSFRVRLADVLGGEVAEGTSGSPTFTMLLGIDGLPVQVTVSERDLAYTPDTRESGLSFSSDGVVPAVAPLIGITATRRLLEQVSRAVAQGGPASLAPHALPMLRCFIRGAERIGVDDSGLMEAWRRLLCDLS